MTRLYRILIALTPPPASEWLEAHAAEYASIPEHGRRRRWAFGAIPLFISTLWRQLKRQPRSYLGGTLMKTIVATVSLLNLIAGLLLLVAFIVSPGGPPAMLAHAAALVVQGGYALGLLAGAYRRFQDAAVKVQLVGSTLALLVGLIGFSIGLVENSVMAGGDPEYGPMTVALLLAAHGLASLLTFGSRTIAAR
jgi:hypothetical protein